MVLPTPPTCSCTVRIPIPMTISYSTFSLSINHFDQSQFHLSFNSKIDLCPAVFLLQSHGSKKLARAFITFTTTV